MVLECEEMKERDENVYPLTQLTQQIEKTDSNQSKKN